MKTPTCSLGIGLLFLMLLAPLSGCNSSKGESAQGAADPSKRPPALIGVKPAEQRLVSPRVVAVGSVIPREISIVASAHDGAVNLLNVREGDYVVENTVLCELRMETTELGIEEAKSVLEERKQMWEELRSGYRKQEIQEAYAKMVAAETVWNFAKRKQQRTEELYRTNAVNQVELDDARERTQAAEQAYIALKASYDLFQQGPRPEAIAQAKARYDAQVTQVAYLEAEKQKRITRAPFEGYVVQRQTNLGEWLSKGSPIVTMTYLKEVEIEVKVDQWELQHVRAGSTATVRIQGVEYPEWVGTPLADLMPRWMIDMFSPRSSEFPGEIVSVIPQSNWQQGSRSFPVKIRLQNWISEINGKKVPLLKAGMIAEVTFTGEPVMAMMVPKDSLVRTTRGTLLYVYDPDKQVVMRHEVQTGLSEADWTQVFLPSLQSGMQVVTDGAERLQHFQPVRVAPAPGTEPTPGQ